ncbi:MAG: type I methionyl aminopeptidase [bacterium]
MIKVKSATDIEKARVAGKVVGLLLKGIAERIKPGISTMSLDNFAYDFIKESGGEPAFLGYLGYPKTICASVNSEVIHGIPSNRVLREGDIIGIDVGVKAEGFYSDAAVTVRVGRVSEKADRLIRTAEEAFFEALALAKPGMRLSNISHAIQSYVEGKGYSVVKAFVGHGIGRKLHEEPQIPNYGLPGRGPKLKKGYMLAIEPMVNEGTDETMVLEDRWTARTVDNKLSSHFEHTIVITDKGAEILTLA